MYVQNPKISLDIPLGFKIANVIHIKDDRFVASDLQGRHCIIDVGNYLLDDGESLTFQEILLVLAIQGERCGATSSWGIDKTAPELLNIMDTNSGNSINHILAFHYSLVDKEITNCFFDQCN